MDIGKIFKILPRVNIIKTIKLNFLCGNVVRKKGCYVVVYKNAVLDLHKTARIHLGATLQIGGHRLRGSRAETLVRLCENAQWHVGGKTQIFYGTTIEVLSGAQLKNGSFIMNTGGAMVVQRAVMLGHNINFGRNVTLYDSDFHSVMDAAGNVINRPAPVNICDDVWLATGVTVLKGTNIGCGAIVGANCLVPKNVPAGALVAPPAARVVGSGLTWRH